MAGVAYQNSQTVLSQAQLTGVANPPQLNVSDSILKAASASGVNLVNTKVDQSKLKTSVDACHKYVGIDGLRQLQVDQAGYSALQPACGWRYKPSAGVIPEVNQAAFGTADGPLNKDADPMTGGAKWYWDLPKAEKDITKEVCSHASRCSQMRLLGEFQNVCGYCKSSGAVIPTKRLSSGMVTARYDMDPNLTCSPNDIVSGGQCPPEGFIGSGAGAAGAGAEGFAGFSMDALDNCESPLTRDCVVNAARLAGCRDEGTLIASLNAANGPGNYDRVAATKPSFQAYQSSANPSLTTAMLRDGSVSVATAIDNFGKLVRNTGYSATSKIGASARDLCLKAGAFDEYNFCAEMTPATIITAKNLVCLQQDWKDEGGTAMGAGYPNSQWIGKQYQSYIQYSNGLFNRLRSTDKTINAAALLEFTGTQSDAPPLKSDFPRSENTRGVETVWIHLGEVSAGTAPPTILRCDLKLAKDGEVLPQFTSREELSAKYGVPADNIGFTSAFEFRPETAKDIRLLIASDDGFMVGVNQNPFENTGYRGSDWGSWRYQGASWFQSGNIHLNEESSKRPNLVVLKFFEGYGGVYFNFRWAETWKQWVQVNGGWNWTPWWGWRWGYGWPRWEIQDQVGAWQDPNASGGSRADMYLSQEPVAPWLNYEVCTRPNGGVNSLGLFERRWNGQSAMSYGGKPIPSFDVVTKSLTIQSNNAPGGRGYVSFLKNSSWKMQARLGFNAVSTLTLMVNPKATLAQGGNVNLLFWYNYSIAKGCVIYYARVGNNYQFQFYSSNRGWTSVNIVPNEWNYVVIQVVGDGQGVRDMNMTTSTVSALAGEQARTNFVNTLKRSQNAMGSYMTGSASRDANQSSFLRLGALVSAETPDLPRGADKLGFEGDVAFIHGFRNYLDTPELVQADIQGLWMNRWPRKDA